jgi:hypothetical protein
MVAQTSRDFVSKDFVSKDFVSGDERGRACGVGDILHSVHGKGLIPGIELFICAEAIYGHKKEIRAVAAFIEGTIVLLLPVSGEKSGA